MAARLDRPRRGYAEILPFAVKQERAILAHNVRDFIPASIANTGSRD